MTLYNYYQTLNNLLFNKIPEVCNKYSNDPARLQ